MFRRAISSIFLGALLSACSLGTGNGFTEAELTADLIWNAQGRITDDGRLLTSKSYEIAFEALEIEVDALEVQTSPTAVDTSFDEANPPDGYSFCHNGHCHADTGELVSYADIRLALGDDDGGAVVRREVTEPVNIDFGQERAVYTLALGDCSDGRQVCEVGPDHVRAVAVRVASVRIKATVYHAEQLPTEGLAIDLSVPLDIGVQAPLEVELGMAGPRVLRAHLSLLFDRMVWDQLEFSEILEASEDSGAAWPEAFAAAITHGLLISAERL